jgi:hypothetical protein
MKNKQKIVKKKIAIIGAGISGLIIANQLRDLAEVKIFEKSRGVGGRMSTRYADPFFFDHGAQCFSARSKSFQQFLLPFINSQDILPWAGKVINIEENGEISSRFWFETHLVAAPNMNSWCKKLANNLDINCGVEVSSIQDEEDFNNQKQRSLFDIKNNHLGDFDLIISTAPPAQTKNLFKNSFTTREVKMQPCFALMLGFEEKWQNDWIFAKVRNSPIKLIAVNSSKPRRNNEITSLVIHSRDSWSKENIDLDLAEVEKILGENLLNLTSINYKKAAYCSIHRWKYALIDESPAEIFFDFDKKLAATSDWTTNSRIEDCFISAMKLSQIIKQNLL